MEAISLYELNRQIRQTVKERFTDSVWITAEITEIQNNSSGHCYLQLADKREGDQALIATARGTIWAFTYRMLRPYFETTTGRCLAKGMRVMLNAEVVYHEVYGFSLNIRDIDPTYTVGDLERRRREILEQLKQDGIIDMNRELEFPVLPKNIAVISSPTAAGLGDFMDQLARNVYGYRFHVKLFPAIMQGEKAEESVIAALDRIFVYEELFDVVVIIRGGGSQTDLGCFDSYEMAANIAQFPLPIIAGIGHERDETIVDRVAHMRVKTPTAAAAFLIDCFHEQDALLEQYRSDFVAGVKELIHEQQTRQVWCISALKRSVQTLLVNNETALKLLSQELEHASQNDIRARLSGFEHLQRRLENRLSILFERQRNRVGNSAEAARQKLRRAFIENDRLLELAETKIRYVDPENVLKRGYSITRLNGHAVKDATMVKEGDVLETVVAQGKIRSEVKNFSF